QPSGEPHETPLHLSAGYCGSVPVEARYTSVASLGQRPAEPRGGGLDFERSLGNQNTYGDRLDDQTRKITIPFRGGGWSERFIFLGGRRSIIRFLRDNNGSFQGGRGSELGLVIARQSVKFGKDK